VTDKTELSIQDDETKNPTPSILISTIVIAICTVALELLRDNFTSNETFYRIYWTVFFAAVVIVQLLLAIYLKRTEQYNLKPFITASILMLWLAAAKLFAYILLQVSALAVNQELFDFSSMLVDLVYPHELIYFIPLIVMASGFIIHHHYKLMSYVSAVVLIIVCNILFLKMMNFYSFFEVITSIVRPLINLISHNYYLYLICIILFSIGLIKDRGKEYANASTPDEDYTYDHDKEPSTVMYFSFSGRLEKGRFWGAAITLAIAIYALSYMLITQQIPVIVYLISILILSYIQLCQNSKRLHDLNISGWYQIIGLIPIVGQAILFWRFFQQSHPSDNIYGRYLNS
jgi:uncharacterized membrane protein YhaH (DUF805 family)